MPKIENVLFFCAGNTCRRPFAELYSKMLKKTKFKEELKDVSFDSAGIYHYYEIVQPGTINYLKSKDIEVKNFHTKLITASLLEQQDLILGFEQKHHMNKLRRKFKNVKDINARSFLVLEFAGENQELEIGDPFSFPEKEYNDILRRIEKGVIASIQKIIEINKT